MTHRHAHLTAIAAGALVCLAPATASAQEPEHTVTAVGVGEVRPQPSDRNNNDAIRRAVEAARRSAIPLAVADARRNAVDIGFASGLRVGAVHYIAETAPSPPFYGPFGQDQGTFGPGRFCGRVPRFRTVRAPNGAVIRRRRIGSRRTCRIPNRVAISLTVTYEATPAA
jgi:hypothetical protein